MAWETEIPKWDNQGSKPSATAESAGYKAGDKPPASWWNFFQNRVTRALAEIRSKLNIDVYKKGESLAYDGAKITGKPSSYIITTLAEWEALKTPEQLNNSVIYSSFTANTIHMNFPAGTYNCTIYLIPKEVTPGNYASNYINVGQFSMSYFSYILSTYIINGVGKKETRIVTGRNIDEDMDWSSFRDGTLVNYPVIPSYDKWVKFDIEATSSGCILRLSDRDSYYTL